MTGWLMSSNRVQQQAAQLSLKSNKAKIRTKRSLNYGNFHCCRLPITHEKMKFFSAGEKFQKMVDSSGPCCRCVLFWIRSNRKSSCSFYTWTGEQSYKGGRTLHWRTSRRRISTRSAAFLLLFSRPIQFQEENYVLSVDCCCTCANCSDDSTQCDSSSGCAVSPLSDFVQFSVDLNFGRYLTLSRPYLAKYADP